LSSKFIPYSHTQTYTDTSFTLTSLKAYNDAIWKDKLNRKQITGMCRWKLPVKSSGRDKHLVKKSVTSIIWPIIEFPLHPSCCRPKIER